MNVAHMMDEPELMIERIHQLRAIRSSVTVRSDQNIHKQEEEKKNPWVGVVPPPLSDHIWHAVEITKILMCLYIFKFIHRHRF